MKAFAPLLIALVFIASCKKQPGAILPSDLPMHLDSRGIVIVNKTNGPVVLKSASQYPKGTSYVPQCSFAGATLIAGDSMVVGPCNGYMDSSTFCITYNSYQDGQSGKVNTTCLQIP